MIQNQIDQQGSAGESGDASSDPNGVLASVEELIAAKKRHATQQQLYQQAQNQRSGQGLEASEGDQDLRKSKEFL
jgi:hypothetical protein